MVQVTLASRTLNLATETSGPYTLRVGDASSVAEVEVCRLPRLTKMYGLRFKRLVGTSEGYKALCQQLVHAACL